MKTNYEFVKREMFGEYYLVPIGDAAAKFDGLISINELGAYIFDVLSECATTKEIAEKIAVEYDVAYETALADTEEFIAGLGGIGILFQ